MTKIQATFSDGTVDVYHGKRPIKAAWAIFVDGKFASSGHSLDRDRARKTAESNIRRVSPIAVPDHPRRGRHMGPYQFWTRAARKRGFATWQEWYDRASADRAAWIDSHVRIEVVDL